jgi:hypothetical protein
MTAEPGDDAAASFSPMRLRYAGTCDTCAASLAAGTHAGYRRASRSVRCLACVDASTRVGDVTTPSAPTAPAAPEPVAAGTAGSSARREYERRSARREARIREAHPRIGGFLLAVTEEPQSTRAWARGATGEEVLGQGLDGLAPRGVRTLHDRRIPRSRANIDHIAVAPTGVWVIDAKRYKGRPSRRVEGGILRPRVERLLVGSRDCTRLVAGVHGQVEVVRTALAASGEPEVPVHGVLCFVDADWPLFGGSFVIDAVSVLWPRKLADALTAPGDLGPERVDRMHRALAGAFRAA